MTTALAVLVFSNSSAYAEAPGESSRWADEIEDDVPVAASGIMGEARADDSDLIQVWRGADNADTHLSLDHGRPITLAGQTNAGPQVVYADGTARTQHVTTNLSVEVDEPAGTAVARSYVTALQALPGFPLQPIAAARYHDRFELRRGQWQFAERRVRLTLVGDVSRHLRQAAAPR
ncbi:nuclear transport factor 2 family protein [Kitasatospora sp. NPDC088264]|uniref:nuclear transport factor 2 family protein n=1 Tax=Kitasatospora sp. NPDC088264 TaxID=3155296 RepID=UPI00343ECA54